MVPVCLVLLSLRVFGICQKTIDHTGFIGLSHYRVRALALNPGALAVSAGNVENLLRKVTVGILYMIR